MKILIIGGTRNIGHLLVHELVRAGHHVIVVNRGQTPDLLPGSVERLRADRTHPDQLEKVLAGRTFDAVVDSALYEGPEAEAVVRLLSGRTGHYIFLSTGQVYLVREGLQRPFSEEDYEGPVMPAPMDDSYSCQAWLYGVNKRQAEDTMTAAWDQSRFPFTSIRMPMVNSERDHFHRLYGYILRLRDGGPILVPETPDYALRHVYAGDVVKAIMLLINTGKGKGRVINLSQDETVSLRAFLGLLSGIVHAGAPIVTVRRGLLQDNGFLPHCSPFSDLWMSELTNERSKTELGMIYTPLHEYLGKIVACYDADPPPDPAGYRRRKAEIEFAASQSHHD